MMRRVEEVMIPVDRYPSVRDITPLHEAVTIIEEAQLEVDRRKSLPRGLLVFDALKILVGCVRRRDLMRGLVPKHLSSKPLSYSHKPFDVEVDFNLAELSSGRAKRALRAQADRPVSDVMHAIQAILQAQDHIMKAVVTMVSLDVALIPVLRDGELVGVVRSVDVFNDMARALG